MLCSAGLSACTSLPAPTSGNIIQPFPAWDMGIVTRQAGASYTPDPYKPELVAKGLMAYRKYELDERTFLQLLLPAGAREENSSKPAMIYLPLPSGDFIPVSIFKGLDWSIEPSPSSQNAVNGYIIFSRDNDDVQFLIEFYHTNQAGVVTHTKIIPLSKDHGSQLYAAYDSERDVVASPLPLCGKSEPPSMNVKTATSPIYVPSCRSQ